jgi:hypothetical protein
LRDFVTGSYLFSNEGCQTVSRVKAAGLHAEKVPTLLANALRELADLFVSPVPTASSYQGSVRRDRYPATRAV